MRKTIISFTAGLAVGSCMAYAGILYLEHKAKADRREHLLIEGPEQFLFPDATIVNIFPSQTMREVLRQPEKVTVHPLSWNGTITFDAAVTPPAKRTYKFSPKGIPASEKDMGPLSRTFRSVNAFQVGMGLACVFSPDVLIRFERGGHRVDTLVCFTCKVAEFRLDSQMPDTSSIATPQVGLTEMGFRSVQHIVTRTFPSDSRFIR